MTSITPDQIKTISRTLRETETERLGKALPNTTVLNAVTRALGLGADFRAFKAGLEAAEAAPAAPAGPVARTLLVLFEADDGEDFHDPGALDHIRSHCTDLGLNFEVLEGANGFGQILITTPDAAAAGVDFEHLKANVLADLEILCRGMDSCADVAHAMLYDTPPSDPVLAVNFLYRDNDQVCTANVMQAAWVARSQTQMSDAEAMMALFFDIEIEPQYGAEDITVLDVLTAQEFYQGE